MLRISRCTKSTGIASPVMRSGANPQPLVLGGPAKIGMGGNPKWRQQELFTDLNQTRCTLQFSCFLQPSNASNKNHNVSVSHTQCSWLTQWLVISGLTRLHQCLLICSWNMCSVYKVKHYPSSSWQRTEHSDMQNTLPHLSSGDVSNQSFNCVVLARTASDNSALLCSFWSSLTLNASFFIVKCSCSPRIYDILIIFVHNNNNNNNKSYTRVINC